MTHSTMTPCSSIARLARARSSRRARPTPTATTPRRRSIDSCGVGLVVALDGKPRRDVVASGHRCAEGGLAPRRGRCRRQDRRRRRHPCRDPAGLLRRPCARDRATSRAAGRIAVGMVFLPRTDLGAQERCRTIVETEILRFGYYIYGWRQVPVDISVIGEKANATRPEIEQILIADGDAGSTTASSSASSTSSAGGSRRRRSPRTSASSTSARCPAARSSTRACSWPSSCRPSIPTCWTSASPRASRSTTSAIRPTPSRTGGWRSRSACWRTTARSTR